MTKYVISLSLSILWLFSLVAQSSEEWVLSKSSDGIDVYHRESKVGALPDVRITLKAKTTLGGAVHLLNDLDRFTGWVYGCEEGRILKRISETEYYAYNRSDFPLWFDDREFVMHSTTRQDSNTLIVYVQSEAAPDFIPLNPKCVRVREVHTRWILTPLPDGYLDIDYQLSSDPGGNIPDWMVRAAMDVGPLKSMKQFVEWVEGPEFSDVRLPHIQEL